MAVMRSEAVERRWKEDVLPKSLKSIRYSGEMASGSPWASLAGAWKRFPLDFSKKKDDALMNSRR